MNTRNCECCNAEYGTGKNYGDSWRELPNPNTETKGLCEFCNPSNEKWYVKNKRCHCKVYDAFTFFNELDLLEIRLNILDPYVDYFVIVESTETFSGKSKPLYLEENWDRFSKWHHKIIRGQRTTRSNPALNSFERAHEQKESLKEPLIEFAKDDDIVYFGDLDEIWLPQDIKDDKVYNLEQLNYCYYLNQRSSERWVGTIVGKWKTIKTNTFSHWRANHANELSNGGWHFTNMGGADQIRKKLEAYDHQEMNTDENKQDLEFRMEHGIDYVGRRLDWQGKPFTMWLDERDWPLYLKENKEQWKHLIK